MLKPRDTGIRQVASRFVDIQATLRNSVFALLDISAIQVIGQHSVTSLFWGVSTQLACGVKAGPLETTESASSDF